ncbi:uncharacterized protein LOC128236589 [Mya arenaria]|uniref:uncharacterized protein LOC128236589 n=1 Tax=Mya arenaria TaxID=6604 RepID=UPI0022E05024|nr:uncharacterized protein LOC128236589 [Mya arenaria]
MMFRAYIVYVIVYLLIGGNQCMNSANKQSATKQQATRQNSQGSLVRQNSQSNSQKQEQSKPVQQNAQASLPKPDPNAGQQNIPASSSKKESKADIFARKALDTMKEVDARFQIGSCITKAREKAGSLGYINGASHFAISWISMYSRYCPINLALLEDKDVNNFPFCLNKELRCMYHTGRNSQIQAVFQGAANIIDMSIRFEGTKQYKMVYRGMTFNPYAGQTAFVEEGFFSASISKDIALGFAKGKILMIVERMYGLYIADYAEDRFSRQKEVLGLKNSYFEVTDRITDSAEIDKLFPNLKHYLKKPTEVIYVYQKSNANVDGVLNIQHQQSLQYCEP